MQENRNETELCYIDEEQIVPNPLNHFSVEGIEEMAGSLRSYGIVTPLTVIGPYGDGTFRLIAGERRLTAFRKLKEQGETEDGKLPCYVIGTAEMPETEQELLIEVSNVDTRDIQNKQMHYMKIVRLIKELVDREGLSKRKEMQLRKNYMRCSERYARFYNQVFENDNPELTRMVEDNTISISRAGRIAGLPDDLQELAIRDVQAGQPQDEVVERYSKEHTRRVESAAVPAAKALEAPAEPDLPNRTMPDLPDFPEARQQVSQQPGPEAPPSMADPIREPEADGGEEDLDAMWEELGVDAFHSEALALDTTQTLNTYQTRSGVSGEEELDTVLAWCGKIRKAAALTEAEWEAVEACRKVVEKFCGI